MPTLDEILDRVGKSQVVSKLDLTKGYYQVGVEEQSRDMTTFVCSGGKFKCLPKAYGAGVGTMQTVQQYTSMMCWSSPVHGRAT